MTDMTIPRLTADRRYPPLPTSAIPKPYRFGRASLAVSAVALGVYLASMAMPSAPPAEAEDAPAEQAAEELVPEEEAPAATDTEPAEQIQFAYVVAPDVGEAATEAAPPVEVAPEEPAEVDALPAPTDPTAAVAMLKMVEQAVETEPVAPETAEVSSVLDDTVPSEDGVERPAIGLPDLAQPGVAEVWLAHGVLVLTLETSRGPFVATRPVGASNAGSAYADLVILRPGDLLSQQDLLQRSNMRLRSTPSGAFTRARLETELVLQQEVLDITAPPVVHFSDRAADQIMTLAQNVLATLPDRSDGRTWQPDEIRIDICFDGLTPVARSVVDRATRQAILQREGCG